jgi:UDP-galactopyranose mutase
MELVDAITFGTVTMAAPNELEQIAQLVGKYCGTAKAESFRRACYASDSRTVNELLDQTVLKMTGEDVQEAMYQFVEKFPDDKQYLHEELSKETFEFQKVKVFERYYKKLMSIMKKNGATGSTSSKKKGLFGRKKTKKEQLPITKQEAYDILELLKALSELTKLR